MIFVQDGPEIAQKFQDRKTAAEILVQSLQGLNLDKNLLVCAIPRGGVVVGAAIAKELKAKLTVLPIKKIGAPRNPELAIGAIGPWGRVNLDRPLISTLQISKKFLADEIKKVKDEVRRRVAEYGVKKPNFRDKTVILTDDGVATGATINLAAKLIRNFVPKKLILAVPVAPSSKIPQLEKIFDQVVVLLTPEDFTAVGQFYREFPQVTDEEVVKLLGD